MDDEIFLAATDFVLPDSSRHLGFCFPVDDAGLDYLQPAIVTPGGHVQFWFDGPVAAEVLSAQWAALGKRADEVFPVQFRCRVPVDGREVAGVIPGIETSADIFPARPAAPIAAADQATEEASYESAASGWIRPERAAEPGAAALRQPRRRLRDANGSPAPRRDDGRVRPGRSARHRSDGRCLPQRHVRPLGAPAQRRTRGEPDRAPSGRAGRFSWRGGSCEAPPPPTRRRPVSRSR